MIPIGMYIIVGTLTLLWSIWTYAVIKSMFFDPDSKLDIDGDLAGIWFIIHALLLFFLLIAGIYHLAQWEIQIN